MSLSDRLAEISPPQDGVADKAQIAVATAGSVSPAEGKPGKRSFEERLRGTANFIKDFGKFLVRSTELDDESVKTFSVGDKVTYSTPKDGDVEAEIIEITDDGKYRLKFEHDGLARKVSVEGKDIKLAEENDSDEQNSVVFKLGAKIIEYRMRFNEWIQKPGSKTKVGLGAAAATAVIGGIVAWQMSKGNDVSALTSSEVYHGGGHPPDLTTDHASSGELGLDQSSERLGAHADVLAADTGTADVEVDLSEQIAEESMSNLDDMNGTGPIYDKLIEASNEYDYPWGAYQEVFGSDVKDELLKAVDAAKADGVDVEVHYENPDLFWIEVDGNSEAENVVKALAKYSDPDYREGVDAITNIDSSASDIQTDETLTSETHESLGADSTQGSGSAEPGVTTNSMSVDGAMEVELDDFSGDQESKDDGDTILTTEEEIEQIKEAARGQSLEQVDPDVSASGSKVEVDLGEQLAKEQSTNIEDFFLSDTQKELVKLGETKSLPIQAFQEVYGSDRADEVLQQAIQTAQNSGVNVEIHNIDSGGYWVSVNGSSKTIDVVKALALYAE